MSTTAFPIAGTSSGASAPRQHASRLARTLGFSEERAGQVALVVSELATNIAKHASDGHILIQSRREGDHRGVEIFSIDKGPGISVGAGRDGYSTAGSLGSGLGVIERQADEFELYTQVGTGTIAIARVWSESSVPAPPSRYCAISVAKAGESVSGDAWGYQQTSVHEAFIVIDGLGHGPHAAEAAYAAMKVFDERARLAPVHLIEEIHLALRATRGAAVAVAAIDRDRNVVRFAGVGNIAASLIGGDAPRQSLASHNGTAGLAMRRIQEFSYPLQRSTVLVMQSDGLGTQWSPESYAGLWRRDPALAAGALYRDLTRGRDDATVLVAQLAA